MHYVLKRQVGGTSPILLNIKTFFTACGEQKCPKWEKIAYILLTTYNVT